ncbi:MAG TPA: PilZ domain-containing protein [Desulfobacteraceae bacterium]|nr:PilZ domain-containing protein [Desulfobacteraceae bacterium]
MENVLERRAYKRFEMNLPATIIQSSPPANGDNYHLLLTKDISHNGAYFKMMKPFSFKGPVLVEILLEVAGGCDRCIYLYLVASGEVVRCDDSGLAVIFNEDFMLDPFHIQ